MVLTWTQEEALKTLDWLFDVSDENRGSGRSWLIAVALIRSAARNPTRPVYYSDHFGSQSQVNLRKLVLDLIFRDSILSLYFSEGISNFRLRTSSWERLK